MIDNLHSCLVFDLDYGVTLEKIKRRQIEFGHYADEKRKRRNGRKLETLTFLGFTHDCSTSKSGKLRVKRETNRKKFNKIVKEMWKEISVMEKI